jgi:preprotein translocase subunit SecD
MRLTPLKKVILIFLLTAAALYIDLPPKFSLFGKNFTRPDINFSVGKFNFQRKFDLVLGLDLAGGSHLVFEADTSKLSADERADALKSLRNVIERRVNLFGVSEPNVQTASFNGKDRVIVELPGVKDTNKAVSVIGQTAQLQFVEFEGPADKPTPKPTDLTGADLKKASIQYDTTTGKPVVSLQFNQVGAQKFAAITKRNVGKPVAIVLDNQLVSNPVVQEEITGGQAQISGNFTQDEANKLALELNAGALPVPIKLVQQQTVGATLGTESIARSINAGLVGLSMVLLFMALSYGKLGITADVALVIFGILTLALYKLIPVVLTLPGIAGFLLSVGMAVDSNILIFERFKEEKPRREFSDALEVSFGRAWDSIRDANISTLVTAFILANPLDWPFLHTSGPVRGFAITLALGILISLFTGIIVSRNLLRVFIREERKKK